MIRNLCIYLHCLLGNLQCFSHIVQLFQTRFRKKSQISPQTNRWGHFCRNSLGSLSWAHLNCFLVVKIVFNHILQSVVKSKVFYSAQEHWPQRLSNTPLISQKIAMIYSRFFPFLQRCKMYSKRHQWISKFLKPNCIVHLSLFVFEFFIFLTKIFPKFYRRW